MVHAFPPVPHAYVDNPTDLLFSVLESAEVGVVVIDTTTRPLYMNASARHLLDSPLGLVPEWLTGALAPLREQLDRSSQVVDRVSHGDVTLRVRMRSLARPGVALVELSVAQAAGQRQIAEQLSRSLALTISDARLLALLWRGMSNEEIAQNLAVRTGTIKSRLFRLYQKLGVKKRPAAVLRAAEVLGVTQTAAQA
ncbi:MAG TPA: LuxR C-terminal-related transcriptional regulator [Kofleriaceae bacterium]|nr:LuxR C-terminal-related transcriptional regulator [Kofleriaceae bacterium]